MAQLPAVAEDPSGWGSETLANADQTKARRFTLPEACTIDSIDYYVVASATPINLKAVIWNDNGTVRAGITWPTVGVTETKGWFTATFASPPSLDAGTYYFGMVAAATYIGFNYTTTDGTGIYLWEDGDTGYYASPGNLTGSPEETPRIGVRVNYTASGAGGALSVAYTINGAQIV